MKLNKCLEKWIRIRRSGIAGGILAAAAFFVLSLSPVSLYAAALPEPYEPQHWTSTGPGTRTITLSSEPTERLVFTYDHQPSSYSLETWYFKNTAMATANITFDWDYLCLHCWNSAYAYLYVYAKGPNGETQSTLVSRSVRDYVRVTGSTTIHVNQGYEWGFIIQGKHFDSSQILRGTLTINNFVEIKELTASGITTGKVYDGTTTAALEIITPGLVGVDVGHNVSLVIDNPSATFNNRNVGTGKPVTISGLSLSGADAESYYLKSTIIADITALPITVTAAANTKTYDGTTSSVVAPSLSVALGEGDIHSFTQAFDDRNTGTGKTLIVSGAISDGNNGDNYIVTLINAAAGEILKLPIAVTPVADLKVYDGTTLSAAAPTLSLELAAGDTHSFTQAFTNRNAGNGKALIAAGVIEDGNNGSNYDVTFATASTGEIQPKPFTVTAVTDSKPYDGTTSSAGTPVVSGVLVAGDTNYTFSQTFDNRNAGIGKILTPAGVVADGNSGHNYAYNFVAGDVGDIQPILITVTAVAGSKTYDGTIASTVAPTLSIHLAPGDTHTFAQTFDNRNVGSGKLLVPAGRVNDGNDGNNYGYLWIGYYVGEITPLPITVTSVALTKTYDGTNSGGGTLNLSVPLAQGDTSHSFTQIYDNRNAGGGKTMIPSGAVADGNNGANYAYTFIVDNGGEILKRAITVTAVADTKIYDGTTSSVGKPAFSGALAQDDTTYSFTQAFDSNNAGTGKTLTPSGAIDDGNNGANYAYTFKTVATGEIKKLPITVTAVTDSKTYDGTTASAGKPAVLPAPVAGDGHSFTQAFDSKNAGSGKKLVPSGIIADGNNGNNYGITFTAADGQITPKTLTVIGLTAENKISDGTTDASINTSGAGLAGMVGGDDVSLNTASAAAAFADSNAGAGKTVNISGLSLSGAAAMNYTLTQPAVTAEIQQQQEEEARSGLSGWALISTILGLGAVSGGLVMFRRRK